MIKRDESDRINLAVGGDLSARLDSIRSILPEAFSDGLLDCAKLKEALGDLAEDSPERFTFTWVGKRNALLAAQTPSTSTLVPYRDESQEWDSTRNVFVEADNLEALKLLLRPYGGMVKMIYIDPPYNTGSDFVYKDNYSSPLEAYLSQTKQKDVDGYVSATDIETSGRKHSRWLSMIYPRLALARRLLSDDGVICVSIDDNEVHNLKAVMNSLYGEENFEGHIHWRRRHNQPNDRTKMIGLVAEHILVYARNSAFLKSQGVGKLPLTGTFSNPDNDPRGDWSSKPWKVGSDQSGSRYKITSPTGNEFDEEWMGEEKTYKALLADNRIVFPKKGDGLPRKKYFKFEREEEGQCATNWWSHDLFGHNQGATDELTSLFGVKNVFSNPKPTELIKGLMSIANCKDGDIVLDFFAGSATTFHASLLYEAQLECICVQLPEPLDKDDKDQRVAYDFCKQHGLPTNIAELGKERMRRASASVGGDKDSGFRVFKWAESHFREWPNPITGEVTPEAYQATLEGFADPIIQGSPTEAVIWEVALKEGFTLASTIAPVALATKAEVYKVEGTRRERDSLTGVTRETTDSFYISLDDTFSIETATELGLEKKRADGTPGDKLIVRDVALDDTAAANLAMQCRLKRI